MLNQKIKILVNNSENALINKDITNSLVNARKCVEPFCEIIILNHYGEKEGKKQLEINKDNDECETKKSSKTWYLINKIVHYKNGILKDNSYAGSLRGHLTVLQELGNRGAHAPTGTYPDVNISQSTLKRLLYWLFVDYLETEIPNKLTSYVGTYDIFISCRDTNQQWSKLLVENLQVQDYKIFLKIEKQKGGEKYRNSYKNAINSAEIGILIHTSQKEDLKWIKDELEWMKMTKRRYSKFKIIRITLDKNISNKSNKIIKDENIDVINFSEDYFNAFVNLNESIKEEKVTIPKDEVKVPDATFSNDKKCFGIKKVYCLLSALIFVSLLSFVVFTMWSTDNPNVECDSYSDAAGTCPKHKTGSF